MRHDDVANQGMPASSPPPIHFGAAYYPEYVPEERADIIRDLDLMVDAGFTLIRVGESVWSTWEPRDGEFDLDWLEPVLDAAHERGISVMLGTPTYAVPTWLMIAHPEIAAERATGIRVPWGVRQETETGHPEFRRYAERIIRKVMERYARHPAVVGIQVDNEPGQHLAHNDHVFAEFRAWLLDRYGDVDSINRAWNLTHWAHRLDRIEELWRPDGNHVPQYDLAWRRFQASRTTAYIEWQVEIVREYTRDDQFVTTCVDRMPAAADDRALGQVLDTPAANLYVATQDALDVNAPGETGFPVGGSWAPFVSADRAWAMSDGPFLVTETNATSVGHPWFNRPAYDGQWRQIGWALIARGARSIGYWHWHSMHGSWESFWSGILPHDLEPGRTYREIARLGSEIRSAGESIRNLTPDATLGVIVSNDARWAWEFHPPLQDPDDDPEKQGRPDRLAYERVVYRIAGGLHRAGLQLRLRHLASILAQDPADLAHELPVLVAPGLHLVSEAARAALREYVAAGGHLVIGPRAAYVDDDARPRWERQPAGFADLAGVRISEFSNLGVNLNVTGELSGTATGLAEALDVTDGEVVARYEHEHFHRWPAVTTRATSAGGRVTVLGTVPGLDLAESLGNWISKVSPMTAPRPPWRSAAAGTVAHSATNAAGHRVWFVHRMSGTPDGVDLLTRMRDVVSGEMCSSLSLGPWDVRVLEEMA